MQRAALGDAVEVHIRIELEDGLVAEDTFADEPITAVLGQGDIHACLERQVLGMAVGEERNLTLEPEEGFGLRTQEAVHTLSRSAFSALGPLEVGQIVAFETPSGQRLPGAIRGIDDRAVVVDFNHPLAGHRLRLRVRLVGLRRSRDAS